MLSNLLTVKFPDGTEEVYKHILDWSPQKDDVYNDGKHEWVVDRVNDSQTSLDVWVVPLEEK